MEESQIVDDVMQKSKAAFEEYKKLSNKERASFLELIAEKIEAKRALLVPIAMQESNLPEARLNGELSRTTGQLKMFASFIREGSWVEASIDRANADRKPMPKPDVRKMLRPVGPVIVFGASNFPFAFSTAGGDSASVLASASTLVIKGHPAHPKTSEMMYEAMREAVKEAGLHPSTIQHVAINTLTIGQLLVQHPITTGVGFTGSYKGGMALVQYASNRENPIPVFAEMGSINPVILYPSYLSKNAEALGKTMGGSITVGVGQFCTNPGLILAIKSSFLDVFCTSLGKTIEDAAPQKMLNEGIFNNYNSKITEVMERKDAAVIGAATTEKQPMEGSSLVVKVTSDAFKNSAYLKEEVFGPYSVVVECKDKEDLKSVLLSLGGQLTSTIMGTEEDIAEHEDVIDVQASIAGRLIVNDVPTGVEVCNSMVHGGPFPATTDDRFTSVGTSAIKRWVRPVCYQGFPDQFLPDELKNSNPLKIWRLVDNEWICD